jgi:uncharacterized protein YyaL (SSP411 family)
MCNNPVAWKTIFLALGILALGCGSTPTLGAGASDPAATQPFTNHLASERSPYLLQHAHNPVDWYPWGQEAFDKARKENKPIFLSIGYSTCHWCHVMERESFENAEIAKLINDNFVAIKVDREERPDLDAVYMQFVTAITGDGGWPMTVFLTPDLKPFFGGTYFPPDTRDNQPGLKLILPRVHEAWVGQHEKIVGSANELALKLKQIAGVSRAGRLQPAVLDAAFEAFHNEFDVHQGGFGDAPKFPRPVVLNFLFHYYHRTGEAGALEMALQTLRAMASGGIHDQLGGGFHRYSTDERWFLPHFEKMLYDQAQLADSYLDAYQITHDEFYATTARDILEYVLRDMTGPEGQFYSAEDADSMIDPAEPNRKGEGAFYVWSAGQLKGVLGEKSKLFDYAYGVRDVGNIEHSVRDELHGQNVLYSAHSAAEAATQFGESEGEADRDLAAARQKLLAARSHRPRPLRDDKTLTAWNGLMISAFARGGAILHEPRYTQAAERAAGFIQAHLYDAQSHKLFRRWRDGQAAVDGFLNDYAFYVCGLLDLYESDFDIHWLQLASELQHQQDAELWDEKSGGYFQTAAADPTALMRLKDDADDAEPAGNSVAALNLLRLGQISDDKDLRDRAGKTLEAFSADLTRGPNASPQMLVAYDFELNKPTQIVLAGRAGTPATAAMLTEINGRYLPNKVVLLADGAEGQAYLNHRLPFLKDVGMIGGYPAAYVCENYACRLPVTEVLKLKELLDAMAGPHATTMP